MSNVICYNYDSSNNANNTTPLEKIYQWDKNIMMVVKGLDHLTATVKVHFANQSGKEALVVTPDVGDIDTTNNILRVRIPNDLLKEPETIFAYIYDAKSGGTGTTYRIRIPVIPRAVDGSEYINDPSELVSNAFEIEELNITGNILAQYITARKDIIAGENIYIGNDRVATEEYTDNAIDAGLQDVNDRIDVIDGKIQPATKQGNGVVQVGDNISVSNGVISVPTASSSTKGVVRIGDNLKIEDGAIGVDVATKSAKGVVKVDDGLAINNEGDLSVDVGTGLTISSGKVAVDTNTIATKEYVDGKTPDIATESSVGVVQVGDGLNATQAGVLSVDAGDGLEIDSGKVAVKTGTGLVTDNNGSLVVDTSTIATVASIPGIIGENIVDKISIAFVDSLPTGQNIAEKTIYVVPNGNGGYSKWIYIIETGSTNGTWEKIGGASTEVVTQLPSNANASEDTDYYLNINGVYKHYRYINGTYKLIGADAYSKTEIDTALASLATIDSVNDLSDELHNLDTDGHVYDVSYDAETNVFKFYEGEASDENENFKSFVIAGGNGGGGSSQVTTLVVNRITESPYIRTLDDDIIISFIFSSVDGNGESVDGNYVWRINNRVVKTGILRQGLNTFDAKQYIGNLAGTHKLTLSVTDESGNSTIKTWNVQVIDIRIESSFNDRVTYPAGNSVTFSYTPYGATTKTVHFILDGTEIGTVTNTYSATQQYYTLPAKTHGAHLLECFITATINDIPIESNHIYKDIVWFDENSSTTVIGCIYRNNCYRHVDDPVNEYLQDYYTLSNGTYTKAAYKAVLTPVTADIGTYYEYNESTYTLTNDVSVNNSKTYYVKEITDGVSYYSKSVYANQYNVTTIPYYVFSPTTYNPTVTHTENGKTSTINLEGNAGSWLYVSDTTGKHNLVISSGGSSVTVSIGIKDINIDIQPVTANLGFDFNPIGRSNTANNRLWVDDNNQTVTMTVSSNFNWSTGGYQTDSDGTPCFCIKAGTTANFSYPLFKNYDSSRGMEFKIIFKTTNVGDASARFLKCLNASENRGLEMNVHEAYLRTSLSSLYVPYSEEDKIELEFNVEAIGDSGNSFIMSYEDGVAFRPMVLSSSHLLRHDTSSITVGSDDCDVYIYRMKAYSTALTDRQILNNFIVDAPNAYEMVARYNRNQIYDEYGVLTPESVANACPDLKVIKIDCPYFTNGKNDFVKNTSVECIHIGGRSTEDNWKFENCYHSGQGTTSDMYGDSARNIDILCNCDGITSPYPGKIDKTGVDESYITELTLGSGQVIKGCKYEERDIAIGGVVTGLYIRSGNNYSKTADTTAQSGTTYYERVSNDNCKVSLSDSSVPNNWFNIKVNVASSEHANNALLQKRYNDYLPYRAKSRDRDDRAKNDMEFFNCVVFIRENDTANAREFNDGGWHFYSIGNIGDSKKTDYTRANDPTDMKEFAVEINDNSGLNQPFTTGVYATYTAVNSPITSGLNSYYERDGLLYTLTTDTSVNTNKTYYQRGSISYNSVDENGSLRTPVMPITTAQWNNVNNAARIGLETSFDDGDEEGTQFEFRYDLGGMSKDGASASISAEQLAQRRRNRQLFKDFYVWVVTSTDEDFKNHLSGWFIEESALYWYLFTERYTMMDNRAKNSFWHFANTGEYREVPVPSSNYMDYYYEATHFDSNGNPDVFAPTSDTTVNSSKTYYWTYAFELWCYDTDSALGTDNNGVIKIPYGREDIDFYDHDDSSSGVVFNAADSTFWRRIRILKYDELQSMYSIMERSLCTSSVSLLNEFDNWQSQFPEELWRLDIERKYYRTFYGSDGTGVEVRRSAQPSYLLNMMNGRKKYQRRQFERDNEAYFATKYFSNAALQNGLVFRCASTQGDTLVVSPNYNVQITPYSDMYLVLVSGEIGTMRVRARAGRSYTLGDSSGQLGIATDTQWVLCWAPKIQALSDLSAMYINELRCGNASKLKELVVGNATTGYVNRHIDSNALTLGSLPLLETLDFRNIVSLSGELDLSGCPNLKYLYTQGTGYTGYTFATYGKLEEAYLANETSSLHLDNLHYITDANFHVSYNNLEKLFIRNCPLLNARDIILSTYDTVTDLTAYGLNWTGELTSLYNTDFLQAAYNMDESYLEGAIKITGLIRQREMDLYPAKWPDLDIYIEDATIVPQYEVTYVNDDENHTVLATKLVDQGTIPPDIVALEEIPTPTKEPTAQYTFSYIGWSNLVSVNSDTTVVALYSETPREYTVRWFANNGDYLPLYITTATYGSEAVYSGPVPTDTSGEGNGYYKLFSGWGKSTGYIKGNTDVYARWESGTLPTGISLENMTVGQIYAVARSNDINKQLNSSAQSTADSYFQQKDYYDLTLGHDFNFSNVDSVTIVGNDGLYTDEVFLDGSNTVDTGQTLFGENDGSFTLAIDCSFRQASGTLVSCYTSDGAKGFRLVYANNGPRVEWGNTNQDVGVGYHRDIYVLRHIKGDNNLYIYSSNGRSSATVFDESITEVVKTRNSSPMTEKSLVFGAVKYENGGFDNYSCGTIHWCKLWKDDIGAENARKLAQWPHVILRMEYCGKERYYLAGDTNLKSNASFISNNLIPGGGRPMNKLDTTQYGWGDDSNKETYPLNYRCDMNRWLNTRFIHALPIAWQTMIKTIKNKQIPSGGNERTVTNKLYIPCWGEIAVGGYNYNTYQYSVEVAPSGVGTIEFFTDSNSRIKSEYIIPSSVHFYQSTTDPTALAVNAIADGDVWINGNNAYVYKTHDWVIKQKNIGGYTNATDGGAWVQTVQWWLRDLGGSGFARVTSNGSINVTNHTNATNNYMVCPCFSI